MSKVNLYKRHETKGKGKGHPVLFGLPEAEYFGDFPDGGGYPHGFLQRAFDIMEVTDPDKVLHVCSGSMKKGVTVDIRPDVQPMVIANALNLPFADSTFQWVMADPPYSKEYAENLYGTGDSYPNPEALLAECLRVCKVNGRVGFMHHVVPKFKKPGKILKVYGISQGVGYNIRAWSVFTKTA